MLIVTNKNIYWSFELTGMCVNYVCTVPTSIDRTGIIRDPKVKITKTGTLDCPVLGIPTPVVKWLKNGEPIDVESNSRYSISKGGQRLEITDSRVGDSGIYECRAINEAGSDQLNFDLQIWGKLCVMGSVLDVMYGKWCLKNKK